MVHCRPALVRETLAPVIACCQKATRTSGCGGHLKRFQSFPWAWGRGLEPLCRLMSSYTVHSNQNTHKTNPLAGLLRPLKVSRQQARSSLQQNCASWLVGHLEGATHSGLWTPAVDGSCLSVAVPVNYGRPHPTLTEPSDYNGKDSRFSFTERVTVHPAPFCPF